jgi:mono/diheme cytochrome c family protein
MPIERHAPQRTGHVLNSRYRLLASLMLVMGVILVIASVVSTAVASTAVASTAPAVPINQSVEQGKEIFEQKCAGCHSIGGGKLVGPDLKDVTKRRDLPWVKNFINDPAKMIASDPAAKQLYVENNSLTMPTLGLSTAEIDALVEYLMNPGAAPNAPAAPVTTGGGDPAAGQKVFTGEAGLANGGPACIACHSVTGTGSLGGGALGPDLTHVVQRLGDPGLSAALKTIAFPTMLGPFQNRPLTAKEQADLVAFLKDADRWQDPVAVVTPGAFSLNALLIFAISLLGTLLLLGLLFFFWQRQKQQRSAHLPVRKV